jgi:transcriptional regulator with XRE-family HTH domain
MSEQPLLSQNEIARRVGCSSSAIHYILKGDREVSKSMSLKLMIATGVGAPAWIFPEVFYNPYMPTDSAWMEGRSWMPMTVDMAKWEVIRTFMIMEVYGRELDPDELAISIKKGDQTKNVSMGALQATLKDDICFGDFPP